MNTILLCFLMMPHAILYADQNVAPIPAPAPTPAPLPASDQVILPPMVDGISERLVPKQSQTITAPETYFSFGIYREFLENDTANDYNPSGLGMMLGFQQHIRGMWSGGVEALWSDWKAKPRDDGAFIEDTSPLSLFSKIELTPTWESQSTLGKLLRPYATGGLGYTFFFDSRTPLAAKSKSAFAQISAVAGAGLRIVLPTSFSIKMGAEEWRGLQTSSYFSRNMFIELSFGDVDKF